MRKSGTRIRSIKPAVVGAMLTVSLLSSCGGGGGGGGADPAIAIDTSEPASNRLPIPNMVEPVVIDGVSTFELSLAPAVHDYGKVSLTDTLAYNDESVLGPTLRWPSGQLVELSVTNNLDEVTTTHWHGADVPADADGGPHSPIGPGETWIAEFEIIQPAATLWYHPHVHGATARQVFAGAAGMIIIDDDNPAVADLPSTYGLDDLPVILRDREFDGRGQLAFELDAGDTGDLNPELAVNGALDPYVDVPAGPVRLRLLNGSQARVYELATEGTPMVKIASDGGYLEVAVQVDTLVLAPGDRAEVVVDLSDGEVVNLVDSAMGRVLELRPDATVDTAASMPSGPLASIDRIDPAQVDLERTFVLDEVGDEWGINGLQMQMGRVDEQILFGDTESWRITVADGVHSFHVHQTQFQILEINGEPPPPEHSGWEDTVFVDEGDEIVIAARFDSYTNDASAPYMFHCHILDHEDLGMMGQFVVTPQ